MASQRPNNIPEERTMDANKQVRHDDPQFAKVLETCLKMEIATCKEKLEANTATVKTIKTKMRNEITKRKQLKDKVEQMKKMKVNLSESLARLHITNSEVTDALETMKANVDDKYKLMELRMQEYQAIVAEYKATWNAYHAIYEEFPLAKTRQEAKIDLQKHQIMHKLVTCKKAEIRTIIDQRRRIDWCRMRCKIIEFARVMTQRLALQEKFAKLKATVDDRKKELISIEKETQMQRDKLERQRKLRKQKMLEMPLKINIPHRQTYAPAQWYSTTQSHWMQIAENFEDTVSINTVFLEEMCVNEPTKTTDVESVDKANNKDPKDTIQVENVNWRTPAVPEKMDTSVVSVAPNVKASQVEIAAPADSDVEMKEICREETCLSQESARTQASTGTKENLLKHSAAKNTEDEIEAKRMRLERQGNTTSNSNKINVPQSSIIADEDNTEPLRFSPSVPKIRKIEAVKYNVTMIPNAVRQPSIAASSIFSPPAYEYCESNASFDFLKAPASIYEGSLCNYQLSPISNMSSVHFEREASTVLPTKPLQQDDKNQPGDKSAFQFNDFLNNKKNMSLF